MIHFLNYGRRYLMRWLDALALPDVRRVHDSITHQDRPTASGRAPREIAKQCARRHAGSAGPSRVAPPLRATASPCLQAATSEPGARPTPWHSNVSTRESTSARVLRVLRWPSVVRPRPAPNVRQRNDHEQENVPYTVAGSSLAPREVTVPPWPLVYDPYSQRRTHWS